MPLMQGLAGRLVVYPPFFGLSDLLWSIRPCLSGTCLSGTSPNRQPLCYQCKARPAIIRSIACGLSAVFGLSDRACLSLCLSGVYPTISWFIRPLRSVRPALHWLFQQPASCAAPHLASGCGWVGPDFPVGSFICSLVLSTRRVAALPSCFLFLLVWFFFCQLFSWMFFRG